MAGPYTNGYGSSRSPYGTNGDYHQSNESFRSRDRAYGGPPTPLGDTMDPPSDARKIGPRSVERPTDLERRTARRRSYTSSRSRSRTRGVAAEKQIEEVLDYTKQEWTSMAEDECIPAQTALQLLDPSSLGLGDRYQEFYDANQQLQGALRAIVNEHYQGFNSSIGIYHQITASIQSSQNRISDLRQALVDSRASLTSTKSEVSSLVAASRDFEAALDVTNRIEQIQAIPEVLEARISEKRFISAVESLQEGLRLLQASQLDGVATLGDMKTYMSNQEHALVDILIEELHNHLYLKSPYCEHRWKTYAKLYGQNDGLIANETKSRELYDFLDQLDTSDALLDDSARNPEADSFRYIYTIVESLHKLGRLEDTVEAIEQRLPIELYRILDRSSAETHQRYPIGGRTKEPQGTTPVLAEESLRDSILSALLGTVYAKFEAIAEAYRAFYEVTEGICKRETTYDLTRMTRSFRELWILYQSEMRSLLRDYLAADGGLDRTALGRTGEENVFRQQRDRSKKSVFRMDWLDTSESDFKTEREDINALWQKQVPGLNSLTALAKDEHNSTLMNNGDMSSSGHKLLVDPSVFNVACLLPPSVLFLKRLKELIPTTSDIVISTLSSFLNDFLINVFHPQLEEALTDHSSQSFLHLEAFQEDPQWVQHANKPIFKGTVDFFEITSKFCKLLANLTHDQLFTQLVITQMNNYYDKCCAWYRTLVTRAQPKPTGETMKVAASLAWEGNICDTVARVWEKGELVEPPLVQQEVDQLVSSLTNGALDESDLLTDRRAQASLCLMYTSMKWLAGHIAQLRYISPQATDQTGMDDEEVEKPQLKRSLTTALIHERGPTGVIPTYLPLSERTASLFDGIVEGFEQLADVILRTLHLELRCNIAQSFDSCFMGSLIYSDVAEAPNEDITKMLSEILGFSRETQSLLPEEEYKFITRGIGQATDTLFVQSAVKNITSMNNNGCAHMRLNIQVLHHSLLVIEPGCVLPRSLALFDLFERGPDAIVAAGHDNYNGSNIHFGKREHEALLKLWYSEKMESEKQEEAVRARQSLEEKLTQLDEVK